MPEAPQERLYPPEKDQPIYEFKLGDETYQLTWQNTWIKTYRTGNAPYDKSLAIYDHVLHEYADNEFVTFDFNQLGPEGLSFLEANGYEQHQLPIPEQYIIFVQASKEVDSWPDVIEPELPAE